jgi:hypothetical protein
VAKDIDVKDLPEDLSKIASTAVTLLDDTTDKTPTVVRTPAAAAAACTLPCLPRSCSLLHRRCG